MERRRNKHWNNLRLPPEYATFASARFRSASQQIHYWNSSINETSTSEVLAYHQETYPSPRKHQLYSIERSGWASWGEIVRTVYIIICKHEV